MYYNEFSKSRAAASLSTIQYGLIVKITNALSLIRIDPVT